MGTVVRHGLRMTLRAPKRSYPRDALISVSLTVRNVSRTMLRISVNNPSDVDVTNGAGHVVYDARYPFGDATFMVRHGPFRPPSPLAPGASFTVHLMVVLRGPLVRAVTTVWDGAETMLRGPSLRLSLTRETSPRAIVHTAPRPSALVISPVAAGGPLWVVQQSQCLMISGTASTMAGWSSQSGRTIRALIPTPCGRSLRWMALAGYVGHPVALVNRSTP